MNPSELESVICSCGGELFMQLFIMKKVPAILSQTGNRSLGPIPIEFICANCGTNVKDLVKDEDEPSRIIT